MWELGIMITNMGKKPHMRVGRTTRENEPARIPLALRQSRVSAG